MSYLKIAFKYLPLNPRLFIYLLLIFATVFHAILLYPELKQLSPGLNDEVFHYSLVVSMQDEVQHGGNPIDHWVPYWSMGFPVFHYYQHFPHLVVTFFYNLFLRKLSLLFVYHLFSYLLLVFYPVVLYFSLKRMNFSSLAAAFTALFSLSLININGYGFELGSFVFRGYGIYSQLWAMFLLPPTLCFLYQAIEENKHYFWSVIFLYMLSDSQLMFGLMAAITALLFVFKDFEWGKIREKAKRFLGILIPFAIIIAYLIIPTVIDSPYYAHSPYDFIEKWDSYGARFVITHFFNGDILDYGRLPIMTVLTVIGLLFALGRKNFSARWAGAGFILWFLLYFGRPTWGKLIDLIPMSSALHLHRFVTMVHFFSLLLIGLALAYLYEEIETRWKSLAAWALILLLAAPIYWGSFNYLQQNNQWLTENKQAYEKEKANFEPIIDFLKEGPPGRVYPGLRANWGNNFRIGQTAVFYLLSPEKIPALSYLPFSWALPCDFTVNFDENNESHYNLFNVRYTLAEPWKKFPPFAREKKRSGRFVLNEIKTTGYFDLVDSPIAIYGDKNSIWNLELMWMRSPMIANRQFISIFFDRAYHPGYDKYILMKDKLSYWSWDAIKVSEGKVVPVGEPTSVFSVSDPLGSSAYATDIPGQVLTEEAGKNQFSGRVEAGKDCFLLFKMSYHPCWHAYIDGRETEKVILSPGMVGVKISKGTHDIRFAYRAQGWKNWLLAISLITIVALFVWDRKRK